MLLGLWCIFVLFAVRLFLVLPHRVTGVGDPASVRQLRHYFWPYFLRVSQHYATPHAPWDMLYRVDMLVGNCLVVLAIRYYDQFTFLGCAVAFCQGGRDLLGILDLGLI